MAIVENWGYGETEMESNGRYEARFVGRMNKSEFIRTVLGGYRRGEAWIRDGMGRTGNLFELELIAKYPDKVIMYNERTHEIVRVLDKF